MKNRRKRIAAGKLAALILCFVLVIGSVVFLGGRAVLRAVFPLEYTSEVEAAADEYDVPRALLYAVLHTESGFDPNAESHAGALGISQITPETFEWLQTRTDETLPTDALYEPETAIRYAAVFLDLLLTEFDGDIPTAVAAYHAGRGQVNNWLSDTRYSADGKTLDAIPTSATDHYVYKVQRAMRIYQNLYKEELDSNG